MSSIKIPSGYKSSLNLYETQTAIGLLKRIFEDRLAAALNLKRVSAPLFVQPETGLNDDLSGIERAVSFDISENGKVCQVVHSLAKWKRMALCKYGFKAGEGLYTDMNAIRRDESLDNLHSVYTDQWDWEKVIEPSQRNIDYLKETVTKIIGAIIDAHNFIKSVYPAIDVSLDNKISFITTQELEDLYPELTPKQREDAYLKEKGTAFIMQIGGKLKSGLKHDGRAPDYDDWQLNGDIMFWDELLGCAIEISSMGIRVDAATLDKQLNEAGANERRSFTFHKLLLEGKLPLTIGGGIGQSRLCMLLLGKAHIGEVQASVWDDATLTACRDAGVEIL